ncbi:MAG: TlyA family RNA methyltransferase [Anaerovoracaceae bacterium]
MKTRLDQILVEKGLFPSRERAKASIMAGVVFVDNQRIDKAGTKVDPMSEIVVREDVCKYVSRGGLKLEKAIEEFDLDLDGCVCVDMGASTGGFTDCMLQNGARKVYAIDVGYGQFDYGLRMDERVVCMEKTNIRYMDTGLIEEAADFISIDVSFISLNLIFPVAAKVLSEEGAIVSLVKPQFEAGREQVGKKGIVRDPAVHREVLHKVCGYARDAGLCPVKLTYSPVTGAKGNIEYLLYMKKMNNNEDIEGLIEDTVSAAHRQLK